MGGVVKAVGNIVSAVGSAVGKVVSYVGKTVKNVVKGGLDNPIATIAKIAAVATGNAWALPLINGAEVVANGGNIGQAALSAAATYAGNFVAGSSFVTSALADAGISSVAADLVTGGIRGAVGSGLQGQNIAEGALGGALQQGLGGALKDSGLTNALTATLGASGGALASQAISTGLRGGLSSALRGGDVGQGIASGASTGLFDSFMNNLGNLGSSAKAYFGDVYKSQVEPLYNAQLALQSDLKSQGENLQNMHGEIVGAYNTYNDRATEAQGYADTYNAQLEEFNALQTQYDAAVASGNTEEADRLADLANAKAADADKTYAEYEKASQGLTEAEREATALTKQYEEGQQSLQSGVQTYQENLERLNEVVAPLTEAEQLSQDRWFDDTGDSSSATPVNEQVFDDGSRIQIFDDGSQIVTNADGSTTVYQDDGSIFSPSGVAPEGEENAETPKNQAVNWGALLRSTMGAVGGGTAVSRMGTRTGASAGAAGVAGAAASDEASVNKAKDSDLTASVANTPNTNYNLGYETDYGKNLGKSKMVAIPGINAPVNAPEQTLTFGDQGRINKEEKPQSENNDYLSFVDEGTQVAPVEEAPAFERGGRVTREDIERGSRLMFMSEGSLNNRHRHVKGEGDGTSDDIPAWLARDEYVIPANVVSMLGNGSSDAGAEKLDKFVQAVRAHKRKNPSNKLEPDTKSLDQYFKGGLT